MIAQILSILGMQAKDQARVQRLEVREAQKKAQRREVLLVDVRTPGEWAETGMPSPSVGLTLQRADFLDELARLTGGDRTRPVAFICRSGNRSGVAARQAMKAGYSQVYNVLGGMSGGAGWISERLPIQAAK